MLVVGLTMSVSRTKAKGVASLPSSPGPAEIEHLGYAVAAWLRSTLR